MKNAEQHCRTKLNVQMYQIGPLFDSCSDAKKLNVISAIINDSVNNDEEVPMTIEDMRSLFSELNDVQRLELIKSLIWTSSDNEPFFNKTCSTICCDKFRETLD